MTLTETVPLAQSDDAPVRCAVTTRFEQAADAPTDAEVLRIVAQRAAWAEAHPETCVPWEEAERLLNQHLRPAIA